ncbi:MAG: hypothetical protein AB9917_05400 [Negativicutes bacterium]
MGKIFAAAGLTEAKTSPEGFSVMVGDFSTMDRHPGCLPGAQISGGDSTAETINILSLAIQKDMTATELNTFQVAIHPLVSASPAAYPINAAAMNAIASNCSHLNEGLII